MKINANLEINFNLKVHKKLQENNIMQLKFTQFNHTHTHMYTHANTLTLPCAKLNYKITVKNFM